MLRCCAAILRGDPSPAALVDINGSDVRAEFDRVAQSLRLAIDFLRVNLQVRHLKFLPYSSQLIALSAYFSVNQSKPVPNADRIQLLRWFWRSSFGHRYSGNPRRNIKNDVGEAIKLRKGQASTLGDMPSALGPDFFRDNQFSVTTVATKTMILLPASRSPRSFLSGQLIALDRVLSEPNRSEYHHCFPQAHLKRQSPAPSVSQINGLANFAIISRTIIVRFARMRPRYTG